MAIYDQDDDQISMASGDEWYFDEFGEYRNANASQLEDEDLQGDSEAIVPDEFGETTTSTSSDSSTQAPIGDEFNETLRSQYINDQLEDPNLQQEAESDYIDDDDRSIGEKIKDKFTDMTD